MAKASQATWGGRFSAGPAELMLRFSESVSFDHRLAPFDIAGSKAHSAMLAHVGLITKRERDAIHGGLDAIAAEIAAGRFRWDPKLEDVHMNIEQALTRRVPAAAKLHTARSRNDQVATDMRLFFKHACATLAEAVVLVFLVMYLFMQNIRYTIIPTLVVPICLLGTFAALLAMGFSINVLTMFGMVLAIGVYMVFLFTFQFFKS